RTRQLHERSQASFRAVIDLMPDLIAVYAGGELRYLNIATRRFLGGDPDGGWTMQQLLELVHPDDHAVLRDVLNLADEGAPGVASDVAELKVRGADGSWRVCEVSSVQVEIAGELAVVVSGRDATERNRMRAKLLVTDRMASLGTLAAGIAH